VPEKKQGLSMLKVPRDQVTVFGKALAVYRNVT
jgi:hypothetical protein